MNIGATLKKLMDEKNMTVAQLSKKSGVPDSTLRSLLNRDSSRMDVQILLDICTALNVSPEIFYVDYYREKPEAVQNTRNNFYSVLLSLTDEEIKEVNTFIEFLKYRRDK